MSKPCWNLRAIKPNGKRHKLCEEHRQRANRNQRRLEARRMGDRARGAVSERRAPPSPVSPVSQLRPINPTDGFRLRSSASKAAATAAPSSSATQSQPTPIKATQVLAQMRRGVTDERAAKRPRRSDGANASDNQVSELTAPPSKTAETALHPDDVPDTRRKETEVESETETETEEEEEAEEEEETGTEMETKAGAAAAAEGVPVGGSPPCVAISSRQWFPASTQKRVCAVCRYENRKATIVTDFCRTHDISLCSRVYSTSAAGPGMCPETRWTCWTKFHRFYQPEGVFSAKGNVRRSSPLVKLRYAHLRSQGRAMDYGLDDEQES